MRKIDITSYGTKAKVQTPQGEVVEQESVFNVKDSLLEVLFHPGNGLNGSELVKQQALALKIEACTDTCILLEEPEWERLRYSCDTFRGFQRPAVEFVMRIVNAPQIE